VNYASFDSNGNSVIEPAELSVVLIFAGYETSHGGNAYSPTPRLWAHKAAVSATNSPAFCKGKKPGQGYPKQFKMF
jgi:hypothetical protein